ncbi:PGG domain - like 10, partial [Theobroma cacao]
TIAASDVALFYLSLVHQAVLNAAQRGLMEFIVEVIKPNIDLLMFLDEERRNIFQIAVAHRQEKVIFFFLIVIGAAIICYIWQANYHPNLRLSFNKSQEQFCKCKENYNEGETPYEAFDRSHAKLLKEGEKWMKDIAQSSTIVGTLIITIMFATLFTVPGGLSQDTGVPFLLTKKLVKVFIISDAISLFASTTSVLMFVGILTSRYTAHDFLKSLPNKLIIGLSSLFISIATMMLAFSSTAIIMLKGQLEIVIPIILLASIPIGLFVWLQFPLLVKIFISTYGPGIFDRKMKKWL